MKAKIMVAVNGSQEADRIVPLLQEMIDRGDVGEAILVRVDPPAPASVHDVPLDYSDVADADERRRAAARSFLAGVALRVRWGAARHKEIALLGPKAESLAEFARSEGFDGVLLVSHGRSWLGRLLTGDALDRVLASVCVPVTVLRADGCFSPLGAYAYQGA